MEDSNKSSPLAVSCDGAPSVQLGAKGPQTKSFSSTEEWASVAGMHIMEEPSKRMRAAFGAGADTGGNTLRTDLPGYANGFMTGMTHGPRDSVQVNLAGIETAALTCALLLSTTLPALLSPPDAIMEKDKDEALRILYIIGSGVSSIASVCCILFAVLYGTATRRLTRDVDCWRLILADATWLTAVDMNNNLMFISLLFFLVCTISGTIAVHGAVVGILLGIIGVGGLVVTIAVGWHYMKAGHTYFYWQVSGAKQGDPVDLTVPLDHMDELISKSRN